MILQRDRLVLVKLQINLMDHIKYNNYSTNYQLDI